MMAKILIHLTHGPENPTQADRAFLIAQTAIQEGHEISMFLAGKAVELIKDDSLDRILSIGETATELRNRVDAIIAGGGVIYLSEVSCGARGITEQDLQGKSVKLGQPKVLVELTVENDRVITYG